MGITYFPYGLGSGRAVKFTLAPFTEVDLGSPITADDDAIIDAATSTELPNAGTKTYTIATVGVSPVDGASTTWVLDVPRNIVVTASHSSSIVACTVTVTGKSVYNNTMSELFTVTATGTSLVVPGKKAFKIVTSIAIYAAGNSTANTIDVGFGDVLGLPLPMTRNTVVKEMQDNATATAGTVVVADTTSPATTSTGDVRGTYDPNSACNGSLHFRLIYAPTSLENLGVTQV